MAQNIPPHQPLYDYPPDTGGVDWELADYDTQLEGLREVHMSTLAQSLVSYLQDDAVDHDSEDDLEERSQINDSSSDSGSEFQLVTIDFN
jgi:hypothetical protein